MKIRAISWGLLSILCVSCEKSIEFVPNEQVPLVVVEAIIENDQPPQVVLTQSYNFFTNIDTTLLAASFIRNASVEISDGIRTQVLKEYRITNNNGYNLYYYSIDSSNVSQSFLGTLNKKYSLSIKTQNRTYTARTEIPAMNKKIDSIWTESANIPSRPELVRLMVKATDPPGFGNYIRYFTKVNGGPFLTGRTSVFDDQIIDGKTYSIQVDQGIDRNKQVEDVTNNLFKKGDTITFKFCNIDKATFDFWRTMEYSYTSIGNPFASPTKVLSNVQGGGLGYFGGYGVQYLTLIAK